MKLSIIIPYYNTKVYTDELLECLDPQIQKYINDIECILIDDGSTEPYSTNYKWVQVIRKQNEGQGVGRNLGLDKAKGDYIQFLDSDDMVATDFIDKIFDKIDNEQPDLIEFSWKSLTTQGVQFNYKLNRVNNRLGNPSVCTRTFKRSYIGDIRFSTIKDATEDEDFSRRLGYLFNDSIKVSIIMDYMYFYRTEVSGSNVKDYKSGHRKTKRVTYYYDHVTEDRTDILDEIKKDDEMNEVFLITNQCDIPELKRYCQILKPTTKIWTHYLKGEPYNNCTIIPIPVNVDVILFINRLHTIGGIETFIYHFAKLMHDDYKMILVVHDITDDQKRKLSKYIDICNYNTFTTYKCKTLIMLRILDEIPNNIDYKQSVQMCHACKTSPNWHITQNTDYIVNVSNASKESFGYESKNGVVIHNPISVSSKKALILVSATRIPAPDKGNNEKRMRLLAEMMNKANIPFIWFNFSDGMVPDAPRGFVNMGIDMDIQPYIARADYLVQLSDNEAFTYAVLEALCNNTAVIVTPFASVPEFKIEDGKNGYIVPFDMNFDVTRLLNVPKFEYYYDNESIKQSWKKIFDNEIKDKDLNGFVMVKAISSYKDMKFNRFVQSGEVLRVNINRANELVNAHVAEIMNL